MPANLVDNMKQYCFYISIFFLFFCSFCEAGSKKVSTEEAALKAYSNMQYPLARTLANRHPGKPESRLVLALCAVFDRKKQDLGYGLPELKKLYDDKSLSGNIRLQAGLAYARAAQTLQMRKGLYPVADGIDFNKFYDEIIGEFPDSPEACMAALYKASGLFESGKKEDAFKLLTSFLNTFKGNRKYLSAVNLLLADQYIIQYKNYRESARHLTMALEDGISNPKTREETLFRIARAYDIKLNNKADAIKYYQLFLKEYPNSSSVPVVKRYLRKLGKKLNFPEANNG